MDAPWWRRIAPWLVLLSALAVRLYQFSLTRDQPVWWDEAEYLLKAKSLALGTPATGFFAGRPLVMSLAMSLAYLLGLGEQALRLGMAVCGALVVFLVYRVGSQLWSVTTGVVAAATFGVFFVPVFYSMRLMTELPHTLLGLSAVSLLLMPQAWARRAVGPMLACAILTRFTSGLLLLPIALYVLASEGKAAFRRREHVWATVLGLAVLAPLVLRDAWAHGHPFATWRASAYLMPTLSAAERWEGVSVYLRTWLDLGLSMVVLLGAGALLTLLDLRHARARALLVLSWLVLPVVYFGAFVRPLDSRFIILALPPLALCIGSAVDRACTLASRLHAALPPMLLALSLVLTVPKQLQSAHEALAARSTSYAPLRDAAYWVAAHSEPTDVTWTTSMAQVTYYSERPTAPIPEDRAELQAALSKTPPRFVVISAYEAVPRSMLRAAPTPDNVRRAKPGAQAHFLGWSKDHHRALQLRPVMAFPADEPVVFVFEPNVSAPRGGTDP